MAGTPAAQTALVLCGAGAERTLARARAPDSASANPGADLAGLVR
ncbi:hypothetical protein [Kitasatospora sp. MBT63]|nr:hypothetical protein [Kitasatospora sp. MBT63]